MRWNEAIKRFFTLSRSNQDEDITCIEIEKALKKSTTFMDLSCAAPRAIRLPLPRSAPGEFVMIWLYLKRERVTYEHLVQMIKLAVKIPHAHNLFSDFAAVQVIPSINDKIIWPVDKIVAVSVHKDKYDDIDKLSVDLFKREIETPPVVGQFQEIPEDMLLEGIFCKWYWDHRGEQPVSMGCGTKYNDIKGD